MLNKKRDFKQVNSTTAKSIDKLTTFLMQKLHSNSVRTLHSNKLWCRCTQFPKSLHILINILHILNCIFYKTFTKSTGNFTKLLQSQFTKLLQSQLTKKYASSKYSIANDHTNLEKTATLSAESIFSAI